MLKLWAWSSFLLLRGKISRRQRIETPATPSPSPWWDWKDSQPEKRKTFSHCFCFILMLLFHVLARHHLNQLRYPQWLTSDALESAGVSTASAEVVLMPSGGVTFLKPWAICRGWLTKKGNVGACAYIRQAPLLRFHFVHLLVLFIYFF